MRWSIRNQILIPLVSIQAMAVVSITLTSAYLAAMRSERQILDRLNGVDAALGHANFPYTATVLARMRNLSGAEFVASDASGRISASSLSGLNSMPGGIDPIPEATRLASLSEAPGLRLGQTRYFVVRLRAPTPNDQGSGNLLVLYPETSWRQARREAALPVVFLGVGSLGLLAGVTGWVAQRIGGRVRRLECQVARIAQGDFHDLELESALHSSDEVHALERSINTLCAELRRMSQTIRQTERTALLAQLAAGLAHQLRNALTGARMSIQLHARRSPSCGGTAAWTWPCGSF